MRKLYVLFLSLFLVTAAAPAHAADNGSWSVYPAASQTAARGPYFYLSADPARPSTTRSPSPTRPARR